MAVEGWTRTALRLVVGAALFMGTLELAARGVLLYPPAHYVLNTGGPEARKLVSIDAASRAGGEARIHIGDVEPDPGLGWVLAANLANIHDGLSTDARRHRTTRPADRVIPQGAPKVLLLGDSFTLGLELRDAQTWAWKLQERTDADIVNAGVHGYGLDQVVLRFEQEGADEHPTFVVLGMDGPMLLRTALAWDAWAKPWFTLDGDALQLHGVPVPSPREVVAAAPRSMAVAMWPVLVEHYTRSNSGVLSAPLATRLFERLRADVTAAGAQLILVHMPITTTWTAAGGPVQDLRLYDAWCATEGVRCVDATPAVEAAAAAGEPLVSGVHWSAEVSARVADQLAQAWMQEGLIPARGAASGSGDAATSP